MENRSKVTNKLVKIRYLSTSYLKDVMRPSFENPNAAPVLDIVIDDIFLSFLPKKGEK